MKDKTCYRSEGEGEGCGPATGRMKPNAPGGGVEGAAGTGRTWVSCRGTGKDGSSTKRVCSTSQGSSPEASKTRTSHRQREASAELHCSRGLHYGQTHHSSLGSERLTAKRGVRESAPAL